MRLLFIGGTLLVYAFLYNQYWAQCTTPPAQQTCPSGCTALTNNANINSGQTYCYTGTGSLSGINFNGGTIIVCGTLTISGGNYNGGNIYVSSTGNLTLPSANLGNFQIVNYGGITANGNLTAQPATIYNASASSTFTVNGTLTLNNSSSIVNNGTLNASSMVIQTSSSPAVCLGPSTTMNIGNLTNNTTNSISAPSGTACVYIGTNMYLNNTLSNTSGLRVCLSSAATTGGSATAGSAQVYPNCNVCSVTLSVELSEFQATLVDLQTELQWSTASESNSSHFIVLRSADGFQFSEVGIVPAYGNSTSLKKYIFYDKKPLQGVSYYKLQQVDLDGTSEYSQIRVIYNKPIELVSIFPNPTSDLINVVVGALRETAIRISIHNVLGQLVMEEQETIKSGLTTLSVDVSKLKKAVYLFKVTTEEGGQIESVLVKE